MPPSAPTHPPAEPATAVPSHPHAPAGPAAAPMHRHRGVLLLTSRLGMGGAERHSIVLAHGLCQHLPVGLAYLKPEEDLLPLLQTERLFAVHSLKAQARIDGRAVGEIATLVAQHEVAVIVAANAYALMYAQLARWACQRRGLPPPQVMQVFHTTQLQGFKASVAMAFYRPWFWAAAHGVFVCEAQRRHWLRRGLWSRQVHTIHNGVDAEHFQPEPFEAAGRALRLQLGWQTQDRVVGLCAVLRPEKAHALLLQAVAALHRQGQAWRVLLIGDGPLRDELLAQVAQLGLQRQVHLSGYQRDVRPWLAACDAIALPSTSETFSLATLEAMAMARPVVMSDVGGAREQIHHGRHGYLFASGQADSLAECLRRLWPADPARQMGQAARARVLREFSLQAMEARYLEVLEPLCRRPLDAPHRAALPTGAPGKSEPHGQPGDDSRPQLLLALPRQAKGPVWQAAQVLCREVGLRVAAGWLPARGDSPEAQGPQPMAILRSAFGPFRPRQDQALALPSIEALMRRHPGLPVLDLTDRLRPSAQASPLWQLRVEGRPWSELAAAVQARLGQPRGSLHLALSAVTPRGDASVGDAGLQSRQATAHALCEAPPFPQPLTQGQAWIDHRSRQRSLQLAIHKLPALVLGAWRAWQAGAVHAHPPGGLENAVRSHGEGSATDRLNAPAASAPAAGWRQRWHARLRRLASLGRRLLWRDQWHVDLWSAPQGAEPRLLARLQPPAHAFWADPFVLPGPGRPEGAGSQAPAAYVFIEELPYDAPSRGGGKGRISVIEVDAQGRHSPPQVCLETPWHLSYPQLIEHEGRLWMVPESSAHGTVDLYVCTHFPRHWRHVHTLLSGVRLADATLLNWQGRWWMWGAQASPSASLYDELHLYHAPSLAGPWLPHALNPVKMDAGSARPAGALFVHEGRLIRPAQDCREGYGSGVVFLEVLELSPERYRERPIDWHDPVLQQAADRWPAHTVNRAEGFQVIDRRHRITRLQAWWARMYPKGFARSGDPY